MPTYLRWIAALTSAVTVQFAVAVVGAAVTVGRNEGEVDLRDPSLLVVSILTTVLSVLVALGVNDWLARRYPLNAPAPRDEPVSTKPDVPAAP